MFRRLLQLFTYLRRITPVFERFLKFRKGAEEHGKYDPVRFNVRYFFPIRMALL